MMALVMHSYFWNRYAAKTFFASLTKIERQEIILSIEYSILGQRTQKGRRSGRFYGKIGNSEQSSGLQANTPCAARAKFFLLLSPIDFFAFLVAVTG